MHELSQQGLEFIKSWESYSSVPYKCDAGRWTIGWGHLIPEQLVAHYKAEPITAATATVWLRHDCAWVDRVITRFVSVPLEQHEYDALFSLIFNIGETQFIASTVRKQLNQGLRPSAATAFLLFNKVTKGGKKVVSNGLVRRRAAEKKMFEEGVYELNT